MRSPVSAALLFLLFFHVTRTTKKDSGMATVDWAFASEETQNPLPDVEFTKQVYEVLLESWKDPRGSLEYFEGLKDIGHEGEWLLRFANSSVVLMEKINEKRQSLSGAARNGLDTILSLAGNTEFLKKSLTERKRKAARILESFKFSENKEKELENVKKEILKEIPSIFSAEVSSDLLKFLS